MRLQNVFIVGDADTDTKDIFCKDGMISAVTNENTVDVSEKNTPVIHFDSVIAFPGLINSHDHLDFNLFPQLGNRIYNNYREWGADIHQQNKTEINKVLAIPQLLRTKWGMYKNLLNGITTVVNHGDQLLIDDPFIDVFQNTYSLHSVGFDKRWKWKLNKPWFSKYPYAIHCGEGTDLSAHEEIDQLIKWNVFKRPLIAIHAVAMDPIQAKAFNALVWCPESNYFLLDKTAEINLLSENTAIIFGTDSTLTASWNIWDHLRAARKTHCISDNALLKTLTEIPAAIWGMKSKGKIAKGYQADLVIARKNNASLTDSFFSVKTNDILLVIKNGQIKMFDSSLHDQLITANADLASFTPVFIQENKKYVTGDISGLINSVRQYYPDIELPFSIPSAKK